MKYESVKEGSCGWLEELLSDDVGTRYADVTGAPSVHLQQL